MPRDRRKAAGNRASPSFGGGVRNHSRPAVRTTRPPSTDTLWHQPRGPAAIDSPGRMHTGPEPLGARPLHENYRNRSALLPPKREFEVHISSTNSTVVDFVSFLNRYIWLFFILVKYLFNYIKIIISPVYPVFCCPPPPSNYHNTTADQPENTNPSTPFLIISIKTGLWRLLGFDLFFVYARREPTPKRGIALLLIRSRVCWAFLHPKYSYRGRVNRGVIITWPKTRREGCGSTTVIFVMVTAVYNTPPAWWCSRVRFFFYSRFLPVFPSYL